MLIFEYEAEIFWLLWCTEWFFVLSDFFSELSDFFSELSAFLLSVLSADTLHLNLTVQLHDFSTDLMHSDFAVLGPISNKFWLSL